MRRLGHSTALNMELVCLLVVVRTGEIPESGKSPITGAYMLHR